MPPPAAGGGDNTKKVLLVGGGILAVILVAIGAFVVLGGDDDSSAELSQADFVAAYNEICLQIDADISALDPGSLEEAQEASTQAQRIVDDGIAELRALQPPPDIAADVTTGTDVLAETASVFGEMAELADQDEFTEKADEIDDLQAEAQASLGPLGIDCEGDDGSAASDDTGGPPEGDSGDSGPSVSDGSSAAVPDPEPASAIADYGSDPALDALADECEGGDFQACDDLYNDSDFGSAYEAYGDSCGGRNEPAGFCATIYD